MVARRQSAASGSSGSDTTPFDLKVEGRRYLLNGVRIPSVTDCLHIAGLDDWSHIPPDVLRKAADRGTQVHAYCEHDDLNGAIDWASIQPAHVGYVEAWERFKEETGWEARLVEKVVCDPFLRVAGRLDRTGVMTKLTGDVEGVYDIKTGMTVPRPTGLQTAGYRRGLGPEYLKAPRYAIHLQRDGKYKLVEFNDPLDDIYFEAAARITHLRLKWGLATLKEEEG